MVQDDRPHIKGKTFLLGHTENKSVNCHHLREQSQIFFSEWKILRAKGRGLGKILKSQFFEELDIKSAVKMI